MVCKLWMLVYDAVEKVTVVIYLLKWPSFVHTGDIQGKRYTLIDVPVHGEQTLRDTKVMKIV